MTSLSLLVIQHRTIHFESFCSAPQLSTSLVHHKVLQKSVIFLWADAPDNVTSEVPSLRIAHNTSSDLLLII